MYKIIIFSMLLFAPFILPAQGNRINVPDDFTKIQDAINSSVDGDTIIVAPGTYYENVNFKGKNVLVSSHYLFDEDVSFINTTIIDGSNPQSADSASVVLFLSGEKNTAILQGFTITGGKGSRVLDQDIHQIVRSGGGVLIDHASPTIRHNIIAYNSTINSAGFAGGGGIAAHRSSAIISNNIIYKNNAEDGGGVILGHSGVLFRNNVIAYNTTNPTNFGGGGVFVHGAQGRFINNTVAYNRSNKGGGIASHDGDFPIVNIENSIIYANTTGSSNTQITGPGTFNITNTNIEGGWAGAGNIDESPLFMENTPLILQEGSPCVDKGDTSAANYDWEDPDNPGFALSPALGTLRNDMGAYGGNQYKSMPYTLFARNNRINVPDDFTKIQDAINSSVDGDIILVAPGTYYENINFRGKNILLSSHYLFEEDVSFINTTIIDGSKPQFSDTASVVLFLNGEESTAILQGFTLTGGKGTIIFDPEKNYFVRTGGGINIDRSSPTIRHNIISFNEANNPGGIHWGGGGISAQNSGAIISNNIIYNNDAPDGGGVLLGENPGSIFRNNVIAYNTNSTTSLGGGGVFIRGTQGRFINNTIAFNHSNIGGGILLHRYPTTFNVENCIIYGNTTGSTNTQISGLPNIKITNTNIEGGWAGDGNMDESPLFIENTALILQEGSPCVDKGDTSIANNDWENPDNPGFALSPALGTLRNDMGAYGGNQYKSMPYTSLEITGIKDDNGTKPNRLTLSQNYPNPFNPTTTISYSITEPAIISLIVYDILGKEVKTLVNEHQNTGSYKIEFNASSLSSGMYFYRIRAGKFSDIKKLMLLK